MAVAILTSKLKSVAERRKSKGSQVGDQYQFQNSHNNNFTNYGSNYDYNNVIINDLDSHDFEQNHNNGVQNRNSSSHNRYNNNNANNGHHHVRHHSALPVWHYKDFLGDPVGAGEPKVNQ